MRAQLRIYARYTRNYNAESSDAEDRRRPGYRGHRLHRSGDEGVEGAQLELGHQRALAALLHGRRRLAAEVRRHRLWRQEYATLINHTLRMNELLRTHGAIMDKYDPEKKIALVVDEWGAWLAPTPGSKEGFLEQQNTSRDAVIAALNINIFARHADRVRMANIAQMVNVLQAMILTDQDKLVLTPTYHVFHMYVPFQDATFLPVTFDAGTYVEWRHQVAERSMPSRAKARTARPGWP